MGNGTHGPRATPIDIGRFQEEMGIAAQPLSKQVETVRKVSGLWFVGIGAFTGLTGLAAFASADRISNLVPTDKNAVLGVLGLSYVLILVGLFLGALAAQGVPKMVFNDPIHIRRALDTSLRSANRQLRISRVLIVLAAALVGIAGYLAITGTKASPATAPPLLLVVQDDGSVICGRLATSPAGEAMVDSAGGQVPLEVSSTQQVQLVGACE